MAPTPDEMGHCDNVYLTEVGDTQVVVFKHGEFLFSFLLKFLTGFIFQDAFMTHCLVHF